MQQLLLELTHQLAHYATHNVLEVVGTLVGVLYLWLEWRASIYLWLAGFVMPCIYVVVYFQAGLYADFGMQVYYILAGIYGLALWGFGRKRTKHTHPIKRTPLSLWPWLAVITSMLWLAIGGVLTLTDSNVVWLDAFTTAVSIVATWMLAKKYVEQWLAWVAVDAVCTGLYIYKGLYFTAALYGLYTIIAVWGYYKWLALMQRAEEEENYAELSTMS